MPLLDNNLEMMTMKVRVLFSGVSLVLALLAGVASAQQQGNEKKPVPTFTDADLPRNTAEPLVTSEKSGISLDSALGAWAQIRSFRADVTLTMAGGHKIDERIEVVQPDRLRMTMGQSEIRRVGNRSYARIGNGPWQAFPYEDVGGLQSFKDLIMGNLKSGGTPKLIRTESLDGATANVYEFESSLPGPRGGAELVKSKIWISASDGLPRKVESRGGDGTALLVRFYGFNAGISIEAPM